MAKQKSFPSSIESFHRTQLPFPQNNPGRLPNTCEEQGSAASSENEKEESRVLQLGFDPGQTSFSFNKFSDEAISEKDNSREANLRVENKSVTGSIGLLI
ncbi:hypothetical protein WN943_010442 [Citrus x changshan-huyou]